MKHSYLLSNNLDEVEQAHDELVKEGIPDAHVHVLSDDEAGIVSHHLRSVNPFNKTDIVRCTLAGAVLGAMVAAVMLTLPYVFGVTTPMGPLPFVFGALVFLGLFTWEGGLWGLHKVNHHYAKVDKAIHHGKHLLIVDYAPQESSSIDSVMSHHQSLHRVVI